MFRIIVRIVFLFAYVAFLAASIRHIAYFFHSFEEDGANWIGAYALAVAIDLTSLVLAIGVMFFRKGMSLLALIGVWLFILGLTAFSWLVNWEYAIQFQSTGLNRATDFTWINPILASAFALLNVAYAVVAELFNSKQETIEEMKQRNDELEAKLEEKARRSGLKKQQLLTSISGIKEVTKATFSLSVPEPKNGQDLHEELEPISGEISPESEVHLGMIERAMYDAFMKYPEESKELIKLSQEQSLDEFVATLQGKYSQYSIYITPARVANVMKYIEQQSSEIATVPQVTKPQRYFVSFEEASQMTGYAISTLKQQLRAREIEANAKGDKLKISSLKIKGNTEQLSIVKVEKVVVTNGIH